LILSSFGNSGGLNKELKKKKSLKFPENSRGFYKLCTGVEQKGKRKHLIAFLQRQETPTSEYESIAK